MGHDPLPKYLVPPEGPQGDPQLVKQYPDTLIDGRRILFYYHSEWRQVESVCIHRPEPIVCLHLQSARSEGTAAGDWIWIETKRGRIRQKGHLFDKMDAAIVDDEDGWWYPEMPGPEPSLHKAFKSDINVCLGDYADPCNPELGSYRFALRCARSPWRSQSACDPVGDPVRVIWVGSSFS